MTKEIRNRISKAHIGKITWMKGRKHTLESKRKISQHHADFKGEKGPFYGRHHTKKNRELAHLRMMGVNHPFYGKERPDHSKRMLGKNNPFFGKKHSFKSKKKSSLSKVIIPPKQAYTIIRKYNTENISMSKLANLYGISNAAICHIVNKDLVYFRRK